MTDVTATPDSRERAEKLLHEAAAHYEAGPGGVDALFESLRQFGEIVSAHRAARRQQQRDDRNARRRARYKANPPARKPKITVDVDDVEYEPGCRCNVVSNPPCTWCSGEHESDDAVSRS